MEPELSPSSLHILEELTHRLRRYLRTLEIVEGLMTSFVGSWNVANRKIPLSFYSKKDRFGRPRGIYLGHRRTILLRTGELRRITVHIRLGRSLSAPIPESLMDVLDIQSPDREALRLAISKAAELNRSRARLARVFVRILRMTARFRSSPRNDR